MYIYKNVLVFFFTLSRFMLNCIQENFAREWDGSMAKEGNPKVYIHGVRNASIVRKYVSIVTADVNKKN